MANPSLPQLIELFMSLRRRKMPVFMAVLITAAAAIGMGIWNPMSTSPTAGTCNVTKIYDGDTMTLQCSGEEKETKVRLYCIDAPEMQQKPWGTNSRDYLRKISSTQVKLVTIDRDRYGRIVGEVITDNGVNLNLALVEAGQAAVYSAYCKKPEYSVAQQNAKSAKKGIWSDPGAHQAPWDWRKENR
jgi:endonuclease YncB( thermonuclease family)